MNEMDYFNFAIIGCVFLAHFGICLTQDEVIEVLEVPQHRSKRNIKLLDPHNMKIWPPTIPYYFAPNNFTIFERGLLLGVMKQDIEAHTLIRFEEQPEPPLDRQFIHFRSDGDPRTCQAYLGMEDVTEPGKGQPIYLHYACFGLSGYLLRAIVSTLGLHPQIQRPDRDLYVHVRPELAIQSAVGSFEKLTSNESRTYGIPYDYGSVVHQRAKWYGKARGAGRLTSALFTVEPLNRRYVRNIGQRSELSFFDIQSLNKAYSHRHIAHICQYVECQNGGYLAPDCSECICPGGYMGALCNELDTGSAGCMPSSGVLDLVDNSTQCLTSPNYGWPDTEYDHGDRCTWMLRAPADRLIDVWFSHENFYLPSVGVGYTPCLHWVEIRYEGPNAISGPRYCNSNKSRSSRANELDPPWAHSAVTSQSNEMLIIFKAPPFSTNHPRTYKTPHPLVGFKLCYKISDKLPPPNSDSGSDMAPSVSKASKSFTTYGIALIILGIVIIGAIAFLVCLKCRKKKHREPPPVAVDIAMVYENPQYATAADTQGNAASGSSEKNILDEQFAVVCYDDLPPKYEEKQTNDSVISGVDMGTVAQILREKAADQSR